MKKLLKLSAQITRQLQIIYYQIRRIAKVFLSNKHKNKLKICVEIEQDKASNNKFNEHGRDSHGFPNFLKR